ncbi:MAG: carbohydrate binding family 9 domain-containing protein, partial [Vicinamibacteria bacterium]
MANPDSRGAILGAIFLALSCAGIASSQPLEVVERDAGGQVTLRAVRIDEPLVVDGVLDESVYRLVPSVSGFIQQDPHEGEPATEDTEMWVLFDDDNIYVAARCWDSRPELIVANEMRRDNTGLYDNDNFAVLFDTFHDRRNAFIFHINPLGGLLDAQLFDENLFNRDWNTVWDAKTSRFDEGWTAEIVVPFKSLRYRGGGPQVWGINARRIVRSKNEFTHITLIPASYGTQGILKVSSAATLVGLETPERSQNIEIKPYARGDVTTNLEAEPPVTDQVDGDVGVDLKYGVTRGMTFDFTYNTDFAQV